MDNFAHIMGWLVIALGMAGLSCALLGALVERIEKLWNRAEESGNFDAHQAIANEMRSASWWYSEDPAMMNHMRRYADFVRTGCGDHGSMRDAWRKDAIEEMAKETP